MRTAKTITLSANGKRRTVRALLDTGATVNYLKPEIAGDFPGRVNLPTPIKMGLGGQRHPLKEMVPLDVRIGSHQMPSQNFYLADIRSFDAILGAFFMEMWGVVLDPKRKRLKISREFTQLEDF